VRGAAGSPRRPLRADDLRSQDRWQAPAAIGLQRKPGQRVTGRQACRVLESQVIRSMRTVSMGHISIVVSTRPKPLRAGTSLSSRKRS